MKQSTILADVDLVLVVGGAPADGDVPAFGRCGPADKWKWLGDVYTPECKAHDTAVRNELAKGTSKPVAHLKALRLLPDAIGSYFRARSGR